MFGNSEISYCGDLVRQYDKDRFLISLGFPAEQRTALWALFAFNHEIPKTREVVSETTLGLIRLQWWRDALKAIYEDGAVPEHEIVKALQGAIQACDLPRQWFDDLTYAREFDLENMAPETLAGLENYADFTHTPLMKLAVQITGGDPDHAAIKPVAQAYAMTGLLRAIPFHTGQGRSFVPADMQNNPEHVRMIAEKGENLLQTAKADDKFTRICAQMTGLYLKQLKKRKYDVFDARLQVPPLFFPLRILWGF